MRQESLFLSISGAIIADRYHGGSLNLISNRKWLAIRPELSAVDPLTVRAPVARDGIAVAGLIGRCPPLDRNSLYCTLLQCTHFADTCAIALDGDRAVGWLSAYRLPHEPETLFVWQVAVAAEARSTGLGVRLLEDVLSRDGCRTVRRVEASVAPSNIRSLRMFRRFAARRSAALERLAWLDRDAHFAGRHESEPLIRISLWGTAAAEEVAT
jgi:L-2,4-diaminobutyric acid acetyltransferase